MSLSDADPDTNCRSTNPNADTVTDTFADASATGNTNAGRNSHGNPGAERGPIGHCDAWGNGDSDGDSPPNPYGYAEADDSHGPQLDCVAGKRDYWYQCSPESSARPAASRADLQFNHHVGAADLT
ncbi:hypothetical protein KTAU_08280 [Thermogemmatispora aurantia]|uniref:Uncharacterized protein n=1 Tax=Thermogemmatispora aurantia TaxID=2045279 RepID=A0A5J4K6A5_9CHLR|nr:hypothetical protein KTAU_08280 [Thermogemmatispora aurantia]